MDGTAESPAPEADILPGDVIDETTGDKWSPARPNEDGVYTEGDWPHNQRLRTEALAKAGKDEDPDGIVTPEHIAEAKDRLDRQAKADEEAEAARLKAFPPVRANMPTDDLEKIARESDPPVDLSSATNNRERVALIEAARAGTSAAVPPPFGGSTGGDTSQTQEG